MTNLFSARSCICDIPNSLFVLKKNLQFSKRIIALEEIAPLSAVLLFVRLLDFDAPSASGTQVRLFTTAKRGQ